MVRSIVDRRSLQHLVDFVDNNNNNGRSSSSIVLEGGVVDRHEEEEEEVAIEQLVLNGLRLSHPHDGGLNVLTNFFARSDTKLTEVSLYCCHFGTTQDASRVLASFQTNRTVTDLTIKDIANLKGGALGTSLCGLVQNMPQLQRLWRESALCNRLCAAIKL
jgi:hypothetical protein